MCPLFDYAAYAATRALVEEKKKQDVSSFHTYTVFLSFDLTLPALLERSLHTYYMCPLFDYAAYAEARAQAIMEKKQEVSSKCTYTDYAGYFFLRGGEENLMENIFQTI